MYRLLSVFFCPVSAFLCSSPKSKEFHTILNFSKLIVTVNRPENQSRDSCCSKMTAIRRKEGIGKKWRIRSTIIPNDEWSSNQKSRMLHSSKYYLPECKIRLFWYHTVTKFWRMRLVGHVTLIAGIRDACKVLFRMPELMCTWRFGILHVVLLLGC